MFKTIICVESVWKVFLFRSPKIRTKSKVTSNISLSLWFHLEFLLFLITRNAIVSFLCLKFFFHFSLYILSIALKILWFRENLSGSLFWISSPTTPITYSCFHKNMEEYLAKYLFQSEKKFHHFNLDLSALPIPVSPTLSTLCIMLCRTIKADT